MGAPVLNVVDVTQWYSPTSGGIRTYLHAKASYAQARGLRHGIVVPGDEAERARLGTSELDVVEGRTPSERWGYRMIVRPRSVIDALERLLPTHVVVHDCFAFPRTIARWAQARGVPVAMVCHSDLTLGADGLPPSVRVGADRLLHRIQRRGLAAPAVVFFPSRATMGRVGPQVAGSSVHVPLGIDLATFRAAQPDLELRARYAGGDTALLLYAGRLSNEKGVLLLPRVLAELRARAHLIIAGAGASQARLVREARRLGVERDMTLLGHVSERRRLAMLMATADCFVHPNPTEAFGLGPLEALAAGSRVVAPATAGCRENLERRGAILVRPGDPAALAEGVAKALALPRPQADLSDLDWDLTFDREWDVYREMATCAA